MWEGLFRVGASGKRTPLSDRLRRVGGDQLKDDFLEQREVLVRAALADHEAVSASIFAEAHECSRFSVPQFARAPCRLSTRSSARTN